jgi:hypothetical protein
MLTRLNCLASFVLSVAERPFWPFWDKRDELLGWVAAVALAAMTAGLKSGEDENPAKTNEKR